MRAGVVSKLCSACVRAESLIYVASYVQKGALASWIILYYNIMHACMLHVLHILLL